MELYLFVYLFIRNDIYKFQENTERERRGRKIIGSSSSSSRSIRETKETKAARRRILKPREKERERKKREN